MSLIAFYAVTRRLLRRRYIILNRTGRIPAAQIQIAYRIINLVKILRNYARNASSVSAKPPPCLYPRRQTPRSALSAHSAWSGSSPRPTTRHQQKPCRLPPRARPTPDTGQAEKFSLTFCAPRSAPYSTLKIRYRRSIIPPAHINVGGHKITQLLQFLRRQLLLLHAPQQRLGFIHPVKRHIAPRLPQLVPRSPWPATTRNVAIYNKT